MPGANFFSSMRSGGQIYGGPLPTIESKRLSQSLAPAQGLPPVLLHIEKAPGPVLYKPRFSWATLRLDWQFQTSDLFIVVVDVNQKQGNSVLIVWSAGGPNTKDPLTGKPFVGSYWPTDHMEQLGPMLTEDEIHQTGLGAGLGEIPMDQGLAAIADAYWLMNSRSPYLLPAIDQNPPLPAWSPGEAGGFAPSSRSIVPGCYEITGTSVNLRDTNDMNFIKGGLNYPDQVSADGLTRSFYVQNQLHTFVRVMVTTGPYRDSSGFVAVEYLRGCNSVMPSPSPWGQYTYADAWRRARMEQALPANQPRFPWRRPPPYHWGPLGLHGVPGEETMTMQAHDHGLEQGLGALLASLDQGLGILGPYGAVPSGNNRPTADTNGNLYEVTGTQVALRSTAGGSEPSPPRFNDRYGANNNLVVEPADQVSMTGNVGNAGGLSWAEVDVKTGQLAGQKGWVAMEYLAPVGWTKAHNGTGPIAGGGGGGGGGGGVIPAGNNTSTTTETDLTPWILGGAAVLGLGIIGWAALSKPKRGGAVRRSGRRRRMTRRRARR